jgi:hypothetical protein
VQPDVIEKKVQIKILLTNFDVILAAHEGKSLTQFQNQIAEVLDEPTFEIALCDL